MTRTSPITTASWPLIFACWYFQQPVSKVLSDSRKQELVKVRQVVQYIAYKSGMTYQQAGELTGSKNSACNIRAIQELIEPINGIILDKKLKKDIETLTN